MVWNYIVCGWIVFFFMYFICFIVFINFEILLISWEVFYFFVEEWCFLFLLVSLFGLSLFIDVYCFCYEVFLFVNESNVSVESESGYKVGVKCILVLFFFRVNFYIFVYWDFGKLKIKYKFCVKMSMIIKLCFFCDLFLNLNKIIYEVCEL